MDKIQSTRDLIKIAVGLPERKGPRPSTICGPLHVQCADNQDDRHLRMLIDDVVSWPGVSVEPLSGSNSNSMSITLAAEFTSDQSSSLISGTEFGRVLVASPTVYLALPLICAHYAMIKGWAEPHFSGRFGMMPPGVMVVYVPRNTAEVSVCRQLFWISYHFCRRGLGEDWIELSQANTTLTPSEAANIS
ncbi:MAG: hypothetical protein JO331_07365 [Verrucomicrobia bacterium]|nr:hypothetical protein [Verrucomicrobiota bacterium]